MPQEERTDTRDRLLESACETFAEKGYYHATVADICERAGANIAAVNYYFRSKEGLYVEAWRQLFARSLEVHPPDGGTAPDAAAEDRFRSRIFALMRRVADPKSREVDVIHKEMANPTGLLTEAMREVIEPVQQGFAADVRDLLGEAASERLVLLCQRSVMTQCVHFTLRERYHRMGTAAGWKPGPPPLGLDIDAIAEHVFRFSLAAIRELRRQVESGDLDEGE